VSLSVGCSTSGRHLPHFYDIEAEALKAVGNNYRWCVRGEGDGLLPL
jgi:hypothetical protein